MGEPRTVYFKRAKIHTIMGVQPTPTVICEFQITRVDERYHNHIWTYVLRLLTTDRLTTFKSQAGQACRMIRSAKP